MRWCAAVLVCLPLIGHAITAKSYIVTDMNGNIIKEQNSDVQRSIASITKLVTTERNSGLPQDELITILSEDVRAGRMRSSPLVAGMQVPRSALIQLALVSSDNIAAIALGRSDSPIRELPPNTKIVEASGLDAGNQSTARELADIARSMYNTNLAHESVQGTVHWAGRERRSTNPFIGQRGWEFFLSKTGYTNPAGGCLVVITMVQNRLVTIVLLGAKDTKRRWLDLIELRKELGDTEFYSPPAKAVRVSAKRRLHKAYNHP